jgi:GTP-binding protein
MHPSSRPSVVIVGRPNVGKSTLFNRITGSRRAIVGDQPGITRDRILLDAEWKGKPFTLTDTGGMTFGETDEFPVLINEQVRVAVESAARIIFVVDGRSEITATDRELGDFLRKTGKPVSLAVNKCDTEKQADATAAFYELGIADVFAVSSEHNRGVEALLDQLTAGFAHAAPVVEDPGLIRVAIIGRPNAGKSTLLNRLTGKERSIVSATAGTTRDAVDEEVIHRGMRYRFVDTAGIRRKGRTKLMAEKLSVVMAQRHIRMADVTLLMLDAVEGVTGPDATIAGYAHEAGKAVIVVVNKWDQAREGEKTTFRYKIEDTFKFMDYAPVVFISALTGGGVEKLYPTIRRVFHASRKRVSTGELNKFLSEVDFDRVTAPGFKKPNIMYVTQAGVAPPTFVFFANRARQFHFSYERFLINQLRKAFGFEGNPVVVKSKSKPLWKDSGRTGRT